jgi:hypothetical protein
MTNILGRAKAFLGAGQKDDEQDSGDVKSTLQENAENALRMKQEAGPQTNIPEHQTSHDGAIQGGQIGYTDTAVGRESTYTSNLKRSHNARTGDA